MVICKGFYTGSGLWVQAFYKGFHEGFMRGLGNWVEGLGSLPGFDKGASKALISASLRASRTDSGKMSRWFLIFLIYPQVKAAPP